MACQFPYACGSGQLLGSLHPVDSRMLCLPRIENTSEMPVIKKTKLDLDNIELIRYDKISYVHGNAAAHQTQGHYLLR